MHAAPSGRKFCSFWTMTCPPNRGWVLMPPAVIQTWLWSPPLKSREPSPEKNCQLPWMMLKLTTFRKLQQFATITYCSHDMSPMHCRYLQNLLTKMVRNNPNIVLCSYRILLQLLNIQNHVSYCVKAVGLLQLKSDCQLRFSTAYVNFTRIACT